MDQIKHNILVQKVHFSRNVIMNRKRYLFNHSGNIKLFNRRNAGVLFLNSRKVIGNQSDPSWQDPLCINIFQLVTGEHCWTCKPPVDPLPTFTQLLFMHM